MGQAQINTCLLSPEEIYIRSSLHPAKAITHINCIAARCLINIMCLYQVMLTLHFLDDVANDAELTQKSKITS